MEDANLYCKTASSAQRVHSEGGREPALKNIKTPSLVVLGDQENKSPCCGGSLGALPPVLQQ